MLKEEGMLKKDDLLHLLALFLVQNSPWALISARNLFSWGEWN